MPFPDYSTTPSLNVTIGGVNVGENCPPGNLNNAIRTLAADGKILANQVATITTGMPVGGGTFTGDITRQGRGGYLHHNSGALASGRIFVQPTGGSAPAMSPGDWLAEYV